MRTQRVAVAVHQPRRHPQLAQPVVVVVAEGGGIAGTVGVADIEHVHHRLVGAGGGVRRDQHRRLGAAVVPGEKILLLAHPRPQPAQVRTIPLRHERRQVGLAIQRAFLRGEGGVAVHHQRGELLRPGPGQPGGDQAAGVHAEHRAALQADGFDELHRGRTEFGDRQRISGQRIGIAEARGVRCDHRVAVGIALHHPQPHARVLRRLVDQQ